MGDISELFRNEWLADVTLFIEEESSVPSKCHPGVAQRSGCKRQKTDDTDDSCDGDTEDYEDQESDNKRVLPAHSLALLGASEFFRIKLRNWTNSSQPQSGKRKKVRMLVPAGQLEAGEQLAKCMYEVHPDVSDCSQSLLLQLLLLADRYVVSKVLESVQSALSSIPAADLEWDTVMAVYNLPAGCTDLPACKGVLSSAWDKLNQELNDLELVWAEKQGWKQQLLLQLPHRALLQLLQDPATCVASETTVLHTIQRWQEHQFPDPSPSQMRLLGDLLQQVRMQHCTQRYVGGVMAASTLGACLSPVDLAMAAIYSSSTGMPATAGALKAGNPVVARNPAWSKAKRPASAMTQLNLEWKLPLSQVKEMVVQHQKDPTKAVSAAGETCSWQGQDFVLELQIATDHAKDTTKLGLYLTARQLPANAVRCVTFQATAMLAPSSSNASRPAGNMIRVTPKTQNFSATRSGAAASSWGTQDLLLSIAGLSTGWTPGWHRAEAKLRERGLVHAGNGKQWLHLQAAVTAML